MTTTNAIYGDYTGKGLEMLGKIMKQGYEEVYFKEAKKLLKRNPGPKIVKRVIGEQQYLLHLAHGWGVQHVESPSYGQIWRHRYMVIDRDVLEKEVDEHGGQPIV